MPAPLQVRVFQAADFLVTHGHLPFFIVHGKAFARGWPHPQIHGCQVQVPGMGAGELSRDFDHAAHFALNAEMIVEVRESCLQIGAQTDPWPAA